MHSRKLIKNIFLSAHVVAVRKGYRAISGNCFFDRQYGVLVTSDYLGPVRSLR